MAGPQFLTPQPVRRSRPRRHFTLTQANSALPLVRRVVGDIVRTHGLVNELQAKFDACQITTDQRRLQGDLTLEMSHLQDYIVELSDIGCELKDVEAGLIDFIGRHQGHDVYLCWKLGEEKIAYFHELEAGFAGRQPVSKLEEGD